MSEVRILPYSYVVGQERLKRALELSFVQPEVKGVLITGDRGTAKSTTVRAFTMMVSDQLPVTLPINATDDRVLGGWRVDDLMRGEARPQPGLLESAHGGVLYVDEVNLLDDHLVNVMLDVAATGILVVQREGRDEQKPASFTIVGTMNPEEGGLRPQLLDRFGLAVPVSAEVTTEQRTRILTTVLRFEAELSREVSPWLDEGRAADAARRRLLHEARARLPEVKIGTEFIELCARLASEFTAAGHRSEIVMANAAMAAAAIDGRDSVAIGDIVDVAPNALLHRRPDSAFAEDLRWTAKDQDLLEAVTGR